MCHLGPEAPAREWARRDFAKRLCDGKCGPGNYGTEPGSEYQFLGASGGLTQELRRG